MKNLKKIIIGTLALALTLAAFLPTAFAQSTTQTIGADGGLNSDDPSKGADFQIVPCGTKVAADGKTIEGIPCDFNQLLNMVNRVIKFLLYLSIPLILGIIIFTAFKFLTANGDPGKLADAKKMLIPVFIGLFWVLAAYIVVYTVLDKVLADKTSSDARGIFEQYFKK